MAPIPPITSVRKLETAEDLLRELSPASGRLWRARPFQGGGVDWIFRGQSNGADGAVWELQPSAFRPGAFLPFSPGQIVQPEVTAEGQRDQEMRLVMRFGQHADQHGHAVPGDHHALRDRRAQPKIRPRFGEFPPAELTAMVALAQHHGIPTRLLDWTWKPFVAAYFAAVGVASRRKAGVAPSGQEAPFSVFALRRDVVDVIRTSGRDPALHIITVPTATNSNLHAQAGLFTLVQPLVDDAHPLPNIHTVLEQHAEHLGEYIGSYPALVEFSVPAREARTVITMLAFMGINAASVYPNLGGVALALREANFYEFADVDERS